MKEPCSMWGVGCLSSWSIWYLFFIRGVNTILDCLDDLSLYLILIRVWRFCTSLGTERVLLNRVLDGWRKRHIVGTSSSSLLVGFTSPGWDAESSWTWETSAHTDDVGLYIHGCCFSRVFFRRWAEQGKGRESEYFWEWDGKKRTLWWNKASQALGSSFATLVTLDK